MNSSKNLVIGILGLGLAVFGVMAFKVPGVVTIEKPGEIQIVKVPIASNGSAPIVNVPAPIVNVQVPGSQNSTLGAVSGPDLFFPYWNVNNFVEFPVVRKFSLSGATASTTPCSIKSPGATTTLAYVAFANTSATSSGLTVTLATAATPYATTTAIATLGITSGTTREYGTSSSTSPVLPNTYFVVGLAGGAGSGGGNGPNATGIALNGTCTAVFYSI